MLPEDSLLIGLTFPRGYSGSDAGTPEELPAPARVHEALLSGAAGGPWAEIQDRVLVPCPEHLAALEWLEQNEPLGMIVPAMRSAAPRARRYRWRASPQVLVESDFEPRTALAGPVVYVWPSATETVVRALRTLAHEVTYVGRADSIARVDIAVQLPDQGRAAVLERAEGRGPGHVMRVPLPGRTRALMNAHREAASGGSHTTGSTGRQTPDRLVTGGNTTATALRRFAPSLNGADWPFEEVWMLPVEAPERTTSIGTITARLRQPSFRVPCAVAIHRAIVRAIGEDVPAFVSGREGDGPLRGAGHLAIQFADRPQLGGAVVLLGIPAGVADADRDLLLSALPRARRVSASPAPWRGHVVRFKLGPPLVRSALPFWNAETALMGTEVPMVLDATGRPRHAPWSIEDAVICSAGYAMRGVLERDGLEWEAGWRFRCELVATLREHYGVMVAARRVPRAASSYVHRVRTGELVVAVSALVNLGELKGRGGGFLALGRARHLGGGLLVPTDVNAR
jgi:CRISPR-associated protein Csb2